MKIRVLPIIWVLLFGVAMYGVNFLSPFARYGFPGQWLVSLVILLIGILIVLIGGKHFIDAGTTFNPLKPDQASSLVNTGIYRYSRNPMYLGFLLLLLSWTVCLGNWLIMLLLPVFILVINMVYILPEELALSGKFGEDYAKYQRKVRRWL